jgi:serine/threonine protein kinase
MGEACVRFEDAWLTGGRPRIEEFLDGFRDAARRELVHELIAVEVAYRLREKEVPKAHEYRERFPDLDLPRLTATLEAAPPAGRREVTVTSDPPLPPRIGRFRVSQLVGVGSFGLVYLAHDDRLDRPVAIKVPHQARLSSPEGIEAHLSEARTVAKLDHPNIVPVYDVGCAEGFPFFVVSKYVQGCSMARRLKIDQPLFDDAAELMATVGEALHYAHLEGVVHRDVKPGNILLDSLGDPHLADFGLALWEENLCDGSCYAGTPAYMSPEQARGEGDRVDGRSDVFSLGVVFYELLTARRPFQADSRAELREKITSWEPRPPRQVDDSIPGELEQVCLKALSKNLSERYTTAKDMADDLRHFLARGHVHQSSRRRLRWGSQLGARQCKGIVQVPVHMAAEEIAEGLRTFGGQSYRRRRAVSAPSKPQNPEEKRPVFPILQLACGPKEGFYFELGKERILLGRAPECDIRLKSDIVARFHAQLVRTDRGYLVEDSESPNGTFVNGEPVRGRMPLADKDRIHLGPIILVYRTGISPEQR